MKRAEFNLACDRSSQSAYQVLDFDWKAHSWSWQWCISSATAEEVLGRNAAAFAEATGAEQVRDTADPCRNLLYNLMGEHLKYWSLPVHC